MFPAQTSLMPVHVALAKFIEQGGNIFGSYPYWYLGTTPFRYLTGPILPLILVGLHKILPPFSLFEIFFFLIAVCWLLGAVGVYGLVRELRRGKTAAILSAIFYLFGPIVPFLFRFSDGLYLIAFSFLPYILVSYSRALRRKERKTDILLCLLIAFVMLLDLAIIPTLLFGMAAIFFAQVGWKRTEEKLKKSLLLVTCCLLLVTFWYTPGYWLVSFTGPSLAGKGRLGVIFQLSKLLPTALAFVLAISSVRFFKKKNLLRDFCFYWLFIFGFLTLLRFLSDPDFWLDWISYNLELQLGLSILGGLVIIRLVFMRIETNVKRIYANERIISFVVCCLLFAVWVFIANKYVLGTLQRDVTQTVEYKIGEWLNARVKERESGRVERVFLSGTTAFWLNTFFDIPQVRGGVDQGSVDPDWRRAVWEIREGMDIGRSIKWLKDMNVSYLVVHTQDSEEFYHDFAYPEKFEEVEGLKKIYEREGDRIYQVLD